jgi:DNA-directed RNA polymerase II subunit RPB1
LVYEILKGISDQDCLIMGIDAKKSRPEDMINSIFPIPPVAVRPSVRAEFMASSMMEDDLTHKLADIIKANDRIAHNNESENSKFTQDHLHLLQYQVASYLDSDMNIPKSEQKGKVTKSLGPRLKGKEVRVRGNLMGKRVNESARKRWMPY